MVHPEGVASGSPLRAGLGHLLVPEGSWGEAGETSSDVGCELLDAKPAPSSHLVHQWQATVAKGLTS